MPSLQDPSKGRGAFVRRKEMSGLVGAVLGLLNQAHSDSAGRMNDAVECWIQNETDDPHDEFSVFQVGDAVIGPADDENAFKFDDLIFEGVEVDEDDTPRLAVIQEPIHNDSTLTKAVYGGITRVRLVGPADKASATPKEGTYTLEAGDSGPCVIIFDPGSSDEEDDEAERIAVVRIGGGGSTGSSSSTDTCGCGDAIPVGTVEISSLYYASTYNFTSPHADVGSGDVTYDSGDGWWNGDGVSVDCPA